MINLIKQDCATLKEIHRSAHASFAAARTFAQEQSDDTLQWFRDSMGIRSTDTEAHRYRIQPV